eukprot:CAMPEP_0185584794 /NCGR_PEP_ID=MMETSP0434-20130131/34399_1 /TAXON_ID=626734 ORGANISM="Favella taraikaensis, Strain Fe Narragansett Bay" /NCGR_SAMPLE_ID=MMETSP0434 /ASSEMBLY_ACC=CAM_ASM_000379 /LENGTH=104 /DNA_ID=CAMNT_0028204763 /DNA_START=1113 /DNA_END=1427 /DNA_ORIENTATION=+
MTQNKHHSNSAMGAHQRAATTIFYSSEENHSDVKDMQSLRDEMNDTGVVELIYGIKQDQSKQHITPVLIKAAPYSFMSPLDNPVRPLQQPRMSHSDVGSYCGGT